jgi:hypothetical protein
MKNIFKKKYYNTTEYFLILFLFITLFMPIFSSLRAEHVETPESFMSRKKTSYQAALEALKAEYRRWCVVAGKPIIPFGEQEQPPVSVGQPPGGFEMVSTPGLDGNFTYEIEQVYNSWSSQDGTNPFSWVDVNGNLFYVSSSGSSSSSSSSVGDQCTGRTMSFESSGRTNYYAGIVLNEKTKSCKLVGFSAVSSTIYFNSLANKYQYGVGDATWTGPSANIAMYGTTYIKQYSKGGEIATIKFYVNNPTPADNSKAVLGVTSVNW